MIMSNSISAVAAYQKVIEANKKIKTSINEQNQKLQSHSILRIGDDLTIINPSNHLLTNPIETSNTNNNLSFGSIIKQEFIDKSINNINSAGKTMFDITQTNGDEIGPNVVELIEALDKMHLAVSMIVGVRDKFIEAYKTMINMPI